MQEKEALRMVFSRLRWQPDMSEKRIRILTPTNLDCIFEISGDKSSDSKPFLKLISVCKVDNLNTDIDELNSPHYFHDPYQIPTKNITDRLIRMNQNYAIDM